jgi:hypothetical protein
MPIQDNDFMLKNDSLLLVICQSYKIVCFLYTNIDRQRHFSGDGDGRNWVAAAHGACQSLAKI